LETNDIFFDLDHTIWDFEANSKETLLELYDEFGLKFLSPCSVDDFFAFYSQINHDLWTLYRQGKVSKEELRSRRFRDTFKKMDVYEHEMPQGVEERYIAVCPTKKILMPGARETLDYLANKYDLHLITNGFAESQHTKLQHSDLARYFKSLTISEHVGVQKPHPLVFETALKNAESKEISSHYVGDNLEADVKGAIDSGWKAYWLVHEEPTFSHNDCTSVKDLRELIQIF
jgi:putative hydrolase of the HAD superfamily